MRIVVLEAPLPLLKGPYVGEEVWKGVDER